MVLEWDDNAIQVFFFRDGGGLGGCEYGEGEDVSTGKEVIVARLVTHSSKFKRLVTRD